MNDEIEKVAEEAADKLEQVAEDTATEMAQVAEKAATKLELVAAEAEAVRVAAEAKRQKQERDRRIAEGGTQIVLTEDEREETGRVEAEGGRVEAEHLRESTSKGRREAEEERVIAEEARVERNKRVVPRAIMLVAISTAFISLLPSLFAIWLVDRETNNRQGDQVVATKRADSALCVNTSQTLTRQIIVLKTRKTDYIVFSKFSKSPEIRAHFISTLPKLERQIETGREQLKKLGACKTLSNKKETP